MSWLFLKDCARISSFKLSLSFLFRTGRSGDKVCYRSNLDKILNFDFAIHTVTCLHLFISIIVYIYACSYIYYSTPILSTSIQHYSLSQKLNNKEATIYNFLCKLNYLRFFFCFNPNSCSTIGILTSINNIYFFQRNKPTTLFIDSIDKFRFL